MQKTAEQHPLRVTTRPQFETGTPEIRIVDLFSGCGGLSLGLAQAAKAAGFATSLRLAVDTSESALKVLKTNFPKATVACRDIQEIFDGALGAPASPVESVLRRTVGSVDVLVGGPPCQGHSSLNNHTRRDDPKNALYMFMARAAEVLRPSTIIVENVPAVVHDRFNGKPAVEVVRERLKSLGYESETRVVSLNELGVAQLRRRHILLATRLDGVVPAAVLDLVAAKTKHRDLAWAIKDLEGAPGTGFDKPPVASSENLGRMKRLIEHNLYDLPNEFRPKCHQGKHSYKSMYGRLKWNQPAQTITSGYGSIGQGRYMHPSLLRALTPHEAARIQGFPDYFDFSATERRGELATMIGNAVPPQLSSTIFSEILAITRRSAAL